MNACVMDLFFRCGLICTMISGLPSRIVAYHGVLSMTGILTAGHHAELC